MKCSKCNETAEAGRQYKFYYGKRLASHSKTSTKFQGSSRVITTTQTNTTFQINGESEFYICNSCVLRGAIKTSIENGAPAMVLSLLVVWGAMKIGGEGILAFIALIFFGVFVYSVINTAITAFKLNKIRLSSKNGNLPFDDIWKYKLDTVGSSLAISIYKKELGTQPKKDDAFFTPDQYANLK
jgi:hypothetical protein